MCGPLVILAILSRGGQRGGERERERWAWGVVKHCGWESDQLGFKSLLFHLLAVWLFLRLSVPYLSHGMLGSVAPEITGL
jgi:hypothetical protein